MSVLADCSEHLNSELIVVEGKSAANAVGNVRDRRCQAVIAMQGKIPNAASPGGVEKLFSNIQVKALLAALDAAGQGELPLSSIKYQRIIVLCDPDADGLHARALLILFFFTQLRTVIEQGLLYIGFPPLYRIDSAVAAKSTIAFSQNQYEKIRQKLKQQGDDNPEVRRYKGLASLDQQTLRQYCISAQGRHIRRLDVADCEALLAMFRKLKS